MKISKLFHWLYALLMFLPIFVFLPTCIYYGFNENALTPTKQVENTSIIQMKQHVLNGKPIYDVDEGEYPYFQENAGIYYAWADYIGLTSGNGSDSFSVAFISDLTFNINDVVYASCNVWANYIDENDTTISAYVFGTADYYDDLLEITNVSHNQYFLIDTNFMTNETSTVYFEFYGTQVPQEYIFLCNVQLFNFTQMFGVGNEPTIDEFINYFPNEYYEVDSDATAKVPNGTYTTYPSISDAVALAWTDVWHNDLFSWSYNSFLTVPFTYLTNLFSIPSDNVVIYCFSYWLTISIVWLCFDVIIYVPQIAHRWLDKASLE